MEEKESFISLPELQCPLLTPTVNYTQPVLNSTAYTLLGTPTFVATLFGDMGRGTIHFIVIQLLNEADLFVSLYVVMPDIETDDVIDNQIKSRGNKNVMSLLFIMSGV